MSTEVQRLNVSLGGRFDERELYTILRRVAAVHRNEASAAKTIREWWIAEIEGKGILADTSLETIFRALVENPNTERIAIALKAAQVRDAAQLETQQKLITAALNAAAACEKSDIFDGFARLDLVNAAESYTTTLQVAAMPAASPAPPVPLPASVVDEAIEAYTDKAIDAIRSQDRVIARINERWPNGSHEEIAAAQEACEQRIALARAELLQRLGIQ